MRKSKDGRRTKEGRKVPARKDERKRWTVEGESGKAAELGCEVAEEAAD